MESGVQKSDSVPIFYTSRFGRLFLEPPRLWSPCLESYWMLDLSSIFEQLKFNNTPFKADVKKVFTLFLSVQEAVCCTDKIIQIFLTSLFSQWPRLKPLHSSYNSEVLWELNLGSSLYIRPKVFCKQRRRNPTNYIMTREEEGYSSWSNTCLACVRP